MTLPTAFAISSAIERVQQRVASAALVYTSHERWPLSPTRSLPKSPVRISVLDSSFNPPTLAHLALANVPSPFPSAPDYDAKLLLLSVRNADKLLQEGDATLYQRVEMMSLLATKIHHNDPSSPPNVAVGLVNEPTFIAKSSALQSFLGNHLAELMFNPSHSITTQLTFLMGPSRCMYGVRLTEIDRIRLVASRLRYPRACTRSTILFFRGRDGSLAECIPLSRWRRRADRVREQVDERKRQ